ncbi:MAG: peptidase [Desulfobulbaceae bacterium]|nr:MAG: peptidase [Desulfobulbaceae bacterium]
MGSDTILQNDQPEIFALVPLRQDLKLVPGPPLDGGSPTWTLHDPIRNLFFRLGWREFKMLSAWHQGQSDKVRAQVNATTTLAITDDDILGLNRFLATNLLAAPGANLDYIRARIKRKKPSTFALILQNYLFFRIPLFKPDRFLEATLPFARLFVTPVMLVILAIIGVLGLLQVIRQWETFTATFLYFFTLKGLILYGAAVLLSKFLHELGHAYTSKYYGLRVPTMGVAFLILWPVLYSDNSDAWRLKSKSARMRIVAAGTMVETALALIATFMWGVLPDGPLRSACFITATVTWVSSLLINLSPFLRFDGYYLLSDFWETPNLHTRSFELGKWFLRKTLWGFDAGCPENLPENKKRLLIIFAYFTWLYRLILFLGIALLIYSFFFKVLGIILFSLEIAWFILLPILRETGVWWKQRDRIGMNRNVLVTGFISLLLISLIFFPFDTKIHLPAIIKPGVSVRLYPPFSAQLNKIMVENSTRVKEGQLLFSLQAPYIESMLERLTIRTEMLSTQLKRFQQDSNLIEQQRIIQRKLSQSLTELEGFRRKQEQLYIYAPADGIISDMSPSLSTGKWVHGSEQLGVFIHLGVPHIEGYADENEIDRIEIDNDAKLYYESGDRSPVGGRVKSIDRASSRILEEPYLASIYEGSLPVRVLDDKLFSEKSLYRVLIALDGQKSISGQQVSRGTIVISARRESLATRAVRKIIAVIIRESSF